MKRTGPPQTSADPTDVQERRPLGQVLSFMQLLWAIDHGLNRTSKDMEVALGVTGPQRLVLRIVGRYPGIAAGEVAAILHLHPSTLTGVLRRLEARGLLRRGVHPADARRTVLRLSTEGRRLNRRWSGTVEAAVRRTLGRLSPSQRAAAQEALRLLGKELIDNS
jgi:DNA-binding MarR family transcriptional regulator